jgi:cellulose synthase/poly-beta-1,6-N-acetylglucosamine synthase-like glycosyltransferase
VVNGPVIKTFLPKTPDYIRNCDVFNRPNPVTGSSEIHIPTTGNALFRRSFIKNVPEPFDPRFGKTGGEDTVFFNFLQERGCRIIWCREAIVYGPIPPERANLLWILKRKFRYGYMRHRIYTVPDSVKRGEIRSSFEALVTLIGRILLYTVGALMNRRYYSKGFRSLLAIAYHIGILACYANIRYEEYAAKQYSR